MYSAKFPIFRRLRPVRPERQPDIDPGRPVPVDRLPLLILMAMLMQRP